MTFPDVLNLNPFVYRSKNEEISNDLKEEIKGKRIIFGVLVTFLEEVEITHAVGQPIKQEEVDRFLQEGEYVYELYSIMVHQGNASGGHYFAYIK